MTSIASLGLMLLAVIALLAAVDPVNLPFSERFDAQFARVISTPLRAGWRDVTEYAAAAHNHPYSDFTCRD